MKARAVWENIEIWPWEEGDTEGPVGTILAEYIMDAEITAPDRKMLIALARSEGSIVVPCRKLYQMLDQRVPMQECLVWMKMLVELVKTQPTYDKSDTMAEDKISPLMMRGKFFVRPEDIRDKAGWKVMGRKRHTRFKSQVHQPKASSFEALAALDQGIHPAGSDLVKDSNVIDF